jgi:glycosyltransferase involved in cell wall biosynthesis
MITCIIPAYNEEKRIKDIIIAVKNSQLVDEIIVVSDGSKDKTYEIAKLCNADRVINLKKNLGKGGAVIEGLKYAKGEVILLVDADLRGLNRENLKKLIEPVLENKADMTIGCSIPFVKKEFSGLRCLKRKIIENGKAEDFEELRKSKFNIENELNTRAKKENLKVLYVKMKGVRNVHKIKKYGLKEGLKKTIEMYSQLLIYSLKTKKFKKMRKF